MSDEDQVDEELEGLLGDLESDLSPLPEEQVVTPSPEVVTEPSPSPSVAPEPESVRGPLEETVESPALEEKSPEPDEPQGDLLDLHKESPLDATEADAAADEILNIQEFINRHRRDYMVASSYLRVDRGKIDTVVAMLMEKVRDGVAKGPEVESLVRALGELVKTNDTQVRLMDSHSKLISSAKSSISTIIQQSFGGSEATELQKILQQGQQPDEDV